MKKYSIFALIAYLAFSCDFNEMTSPQDQSQKWNLVGYQEDVAGEMKYTSLQDSAYVYSLFPDGTFIKTVGENKLDGTYEQSFSEGLTRYTFKFAEDGDLLIHGCSSGSEEYFINSKGQLTGTWDSCDHPKLFFDLQ